MSLGENDPDELVIHLVIFQKLTHKFCEWKCILNNEKYRTLILENKIQNIILNSVNIR